MSDFEEFQEAQNTEIIIIDNEEALKRREEDRHKKEIESLRLKAERANKRAKRSNIIILLCLLVVLILEAGSLVRTMVQNNGENDVSTTQTVIMNSDLYLTDVSSIVADVMPSVVSITSRTIVNTGNYWGLWGFYSNQQETTEEVESGIGSGTIIGKNDSELLVLTSYHVVEDCSSLYVTFNDDSSVDGYIKNADEETDIAIVAVPLTDIEDATMDVIKIATLSAETVEVGQGVIVIGDALGYGQSVVTGIVSATSREITLDDDTTITVLQTDAAINSGNSGGGVC